MIAIFNQRDGASQCLQLSGAGNEKTATAAKPADVEEFAGEKKFCQLTRPDCIA